MTTIGGSSTDHQGAAPSPRSKRGSVRGAGVETTTPTTRPAGLAGLRTGAAGITSGSGTAGSTTTGSAIGSMTSRARGSASRPARRSRSAITSAKRSSVAPLPRADSTMLATVALGARSPMVATNPRTRRAAPAARLHRRPKARPWGPRVGPKTAAGSESSGEVSHHSPAGLPAEIGRTCSMR